MVAESLIRTGGVGEAAPLRWWSTAQLEGLRQDVLRASTAFAADWAITGFTIEGVWCAHEAPCDLKPMPWRPVGVRGASGAWLATAAGTRCGEGTGMFAALIGHGALASEVAKDCDAGFLDCLASLLDLDPAPATAQPSRDFWHSWSGAVVVSLRLAESHVHLAVSPHCVQSWIDRLGLATRQTQRGADKLPLAPLSDAVSARTICLSAVLAACELELGSLVALSAGDIVRLEHPLGEPLQVEDSHGVLLFSGWLGRAGASKAIELSSLTH